MEYITTKEASEKWGISPTRITILANQGRIPGAERLGKSWLIPADATKPPERKSTPSRKNKEEIDDFSFPLYYFRPDWSYTKELQLPKQQKRLLMAEKAVLECRFSDAYPVLDAILHEPDDNITEIGCLWNAGLCCIALNKPDDFSKIYMRLQFLLADDFPHRNDFTVMLEILKTYVETISSMAQSTAFNTDVHDQALPITSLLIGYAYMTKEAMKPGTTDTSLLEINLRYLKSTSSVIAVEMMHFYLLGIYFIRQDFGAAENHAEAAVKIAFETKLYFPIVSFYRYFAPVISPVIERYPEEFQNHCYELISQYEENFTAFLSTTNESMVISKLTDLDYPYLYSVMMNESIPTIASKLGVSQQTVKRRLTSLYGKLGVKSKKELRNYLHDFM